MSLLLLALAVGSLVLHEWAHGWTAAAFGDPLARLLGRDKLNPLSHLDFYGSIFLPGVCVAVGFPPIGWGRAVAFSPTRLGRRRALVVLAAGPAMNLLLAGVALLVGFRPLLEVNLALAAFNLLPIGTLDGRRILHLLRNEAPQ